ncbi:hypothetical protein CDD83_7439 [Cordyceps sp. RAO-2017]|nr:hypothetical protein CDD83_7439 [Cordyceps sp. RAO-2017]
MGRAVNLTRCYSHSSAGELSSGQGPAGLPLTHEQLLSEFARHCIRGNRRPTCLVSASDRMLDTVQRAFNKHYEEGESPDEISIVFIQIPADRIEYTKLHAAPELARQCGHDEPGKFKHEYLFEWAIPQEYVVHTVTLQTLRDRGLASELDEFRCTEQGILPPVSILKKAMAEHYLRDNQDYWDIGVALGYLARNFGAKAPVHWIANQIFLDLVYYPPWVDCDGDFRSGVIKYPDETTESFSHDVFYLLEDGITKALDDWWLFTNDFVSAVEDYNDWCDRSLDRLNDKWLSFDELWTGYEHTAAYRDARAELDLMEERLDAEIEEEGIKAGL